MEVQRFPESVIWMAFHYAGTYRCHILVAVQSFPKRTIHERVNAPAHKKGAVKNAT
jgi:hypothetical protein